MAEPIASTKQHRGSASTRPALGGTLTREIDKLGAGGPHPEWQPVVAAKGMGSWKGAAFGVLLLALSLRQAVGQVSSLEVLVLDSPPFTCNDEFPCYSANPPVEAASNGCLPGSRKTKNGVCVHGMSIDLLMALETRIRKQPWATPDFTFNIVCHPRHQRGVATPG